MCFAKVYGLASLKMALVRSRGWVFSFSGVEVQGLKAFWSKAWFEV